MKFGKFLVPVLGIALGAVAFSSCNQIKEGSKVHVGLNSQDVDFTIPIVTQAGTDVQLAAFDVYINVDSIIKANNASVAASMIQSVNIVSCVLTMNDGDILNNFANLQSGKAELKSNTKTDFVTVAQVTSNQDVQAFTLNMPVNSSINLKDYFNATLFSYKLTGNARRVTTKELHCKATITYDLIAGF